MVAMAVGCSTDILGVLRHDKEKGRHHMTRALNAGRKEAISGETRSCVVFLHGYGANGADLLSLADPLGEHMP